MVFKEFYHELSGSGNYPIFHNIFFLFDIRSFKYAYRSPFFIRGRMAIVGPMIDEAEAAVIVNEASMAFGCMGCARTNELTKYLIRKKEIPILEVDYPRSEEEGKEFVYKIAEFLKSLPMEERS